MSAEERSRGDQGGGIVVIGLGRFGFNLAESLTDLGHDVLAIDENPATVQRWSQRLTRVVQADSTEEDVLRQLGVADFGRIVVAFGSAVEANVLTVLALKEINVPEIWARATSRKHAKILEAVGADHVIYMEEEMGERIAHLITSRLLDFIEFGDDFAVAKVAVPAPLAGRALSDIPVAERHGVRVVGAKFPGQRFQYARPEMVLVPGTILIVEGSVRQVHRFADMS